MIAVAVALLLAESFGRDVIWQYRTVLLGDEQPGSPISGPRATHNVPTSIITRAHLSSWAGRAPLDNQSGKRNGKAESKKGNRYLGAILGETAVAAGRTQTREGARYRRLARRRGKAKAQVAVGNTQLKVYHRLLSSPGTRYEDLGPDYYERQAGTRRQIAHHVGKLGALGFEVTLCRIPEPGPSGSGNTQAA